MKLRIGSHSDRFTTPGRYGELETQIRSHIDGSNLALASPRFEKVWADRIAFRLLGMVGLVKSIYKSRAWLARLISGPIEKLAELPRARFPMFPPSDVSPALIQGGR
jgi:hypothetical protein